MNDTPPPAIPKLPRENAYLCPACKNAVCTVDVDVGVTPFMIACDACGGRMESCFYPQEPRPPHIPAPTREWYKPGPEEFSRLCPEERHHVARGGLLLRNRTDAEPVYHGEESPQDMTQEVMVLKNYDNGPTQTPRAGTVTRPPKPPRNSPCPCGSGKKFKHCCA